MGDLCEETENEQQENKGAAEISEPRIGKELSNFLLNITSISDTIDITMHAIEEELVRTYDQFTEFSKRNLISLEQNGETKVMIKAECFQTYKDLLKQLRTYHLASKTIPRGFVMALISQYDAFLGRLIKIILSTKPEMLNASEKSISFTELVNFGSVEDAWKFILEKETESVIRKSHAEQFDWMENKFSMQLKKELAIWPEFIEITERRNLFVHTDGVVSDQYLRVCKQHGASIDGIIIGKELFVTPEYFENSYNVIFEIAFKLAHVLWRKFMPDELEEADNNLITIGYDSLHEENYRLATMIFDFATHTLKKHFSDSDRRIMVVNQAQAYKWSGNEKKAREIITREDWSATSGKFRLAEAVILENYEKAFEIMQEIGTNENELELNNYREWPLFNEIRKEKRFVELFEQIFGEPYNKVEPEDLSLPEDLEPETIGEIQLDNANCS